MRKRFDFNSKIAQKGNNVKFHCQKVESSRNEKLRRLSGRLLSGVWRKRFKIWSLPDYPGELTALKHW